MRKPQILKMVRIRTLNWPLNLSLYSMVAFFEPVTEPVVNLSPYSRQWRRAALDARWNGFWNDAVPEAGAPMRLRNGFRNEPRAGGSLSLTSILPPRTLRDRGEIEGQVQST